MLNIFANSEHIFFGICRGSILRIALVIRLKSEPNQFFGPKLSPKVPKSMSCESLVKVGWQLKMTIRHDLLRMVYHRWTTGCIKFFGPPPQNDQGCSKICIPLKQREVPQKYGVFSGLIWWNSKSFYIAKTMTNIKLADLLKWPKDPSFL